MEKTNLYEEIEGVLAKIPIDFGGGCSVEKAHMMCWLIKRKDIKKTLDIGVYRGRSLFPQAITHKEYTGGVVYGVDPWANKEALEKDNKELAKEIKEFIDSSDFQAIYEDVCLFRKKLKLEKNCLLVRKKAEVAVEQFVQDNIKFGLIHIDGNHDYEMVMKDIEMYVPLLEKNGILVMDDISWSSVQPALDTLDGKMNLLYSKVDKMNDYAIYWNNKSKLLTAILSKRLKQLIKE